MSYSIIALSFLLSAVLAADYPITWDSELEEELPQEFSSRNSDQNYRLPGDVIPHEYDIYIDLYFDERGDRPFSYDGRENIIIQAVKENVKQITLHANVDRINGYSVMTEAGTPVKIDVDQPMIIEPQFHFLRINLAENLVQGQNYTLFIDYTSTMNEGPMKRGIWKGSYIDDDNQERFYATTHFQPYNARQAFPCWDEPLYKAVFKLHLSRPSNFTTSYSNTPISIIEDNLSDRIRENFFPTPKMSSYLVTFLVSDTFKVIAEDTSFSPPVRIIGRSNTLGLADKALEFAVKMTKYFGDFLEYPYSTLHPNLNNDHVSSPDWASAGTENWGMVGYRELYLILNSSETIMSVEHYAATLVSHELAHKWFGNLITCFWWSNTWINEGFASYFGYIATHEVFPEYELHEHFNSRYLQASLSFDSGTGTVPMNHDVNTPAQVTGHFGTISYSKAAAFLRMTVDMITQPTFRKACQYFLRDYPFEPTDQYDLYKAFDRAVREDGTLNEYLNFNFTHYYDVWVNQPGYPILNVSIDHATGEMSLSQERFFISASASPTGQIYPIPITYSTKTNPGFSNLKPVYMMSGEKAVLNKAAGEEWVIFNHQQHALYRVNYDDTTWDLISEGLLNEPENIHHLNRAQVVDDVFALMRSQRMTYEKGFHILRFLRNEKNYHVWNPAISGLTWLRNRLRFLPESLAEFDSIVLGLMEYAIEELKFEPASGETPTVSLTRQEILQFACNIGHQKCVEDSKQKYSAMMDGAWIDPRIRRHVYMTGVREGGRQEFEFLLHRHEQSNYANDQLEMLRGLGATRDPQLLTEYLQLTLTKSVRSHDKLNSFNFALQGNPENANTVLEFVKNNIADIRVAYVEDAPPTPVNSALSNLAAYLDEAGLEDYEKWVQNTQANTLQYNSALSGIRSARQNNAWGEANADMILSAMKEAQDSMPGGSATVAVSTALLLATAVLVRFA
ncbi:hypothetical protein ABMA27_001075 [Loxostege sticticalis]|uniref:Aminopeptidase n=1 Tax=Loxostege sticticalis TaxID=481309 RepID=A0ABR3I1F9_LOXSC